MKILQINNHNKKVGGAESVYLSTIELLRKNGHEVFSFSRNESGLLNPGDGDYFIEYSNAFHKRFYSRSSATMIEKIIKEKKPDIAHIHNIVGGITYSILPMLKKYKIPVIMSVHDFRLLCPVAIYLDGSGEVCEECRGKKYFNCVRKNCSPDGIIRSIGIAAESYLRDTFIPFQDFISHFIFVSDFAKNKFLESKPDLEKLSSRIYNFTDSFNRNIMHGDYFLFFGRLAREKGLLTLLDSIRKLPQLKLKIAGTGILKNTIEEILPPNVELLGYKTGNELASLIHNASFIISPSECYETLSMATVEAFAMGKPVIGTNLGALPELIKDGETGLLFNPKDSDSLSQLMSYASELDEKRYSQMSDNAFKFASENFSAETYYKQLMNVYENVLEGNRN